MAKPSLSDEQLFQAWLVRGSIRGAFEELGMAYGSKPLDRLKKVIRERTHDAALDIPDVPTTERSTDEIIDMAVAHRKRLQANLRAKQSSVIPLPDDKPFAVAVLPDQHMDNPGSNLQLIYEHASLIYKTPGMYCVEVGDAIDNFIVGKLERARRQSLVTVNESWLLVEDYHRRLGPKLLAAIAGNHLNWTYQLGGVDYLQRVLRDSGINALYDADELFFYLRTPNKRQWMWGMRHFFQGGSMYNAAHSLVRYAMSHAYKGEDVVVSGHKHVAGYSCINTKGKTVECIQVGSYKDRDLDDYCRTQGFMAQHPFVVPVVIHNPDTGRLTFVKELEEAVPFLKYLRAKK